MVALANAAHVSVRTWSGVALLTLRPVEADRPAVVGLVLKLTLTLAFAGSLAAAVSVAAVAQGEKLLACSFAAGLGRVLQGLKELLLFSLFL